MRLFDELQFSEAGLIPTVIQDAVDAQVLTLCYMTREALEKTLETGLVHVFRRSKGRLMIKGETSGHTQAVKAAFIDCEGKSLVIKVEQKVAGCHMGYKSCYFRRYRSAGDEFTIEEERVFNPEDVY